MATALLGLVASSSVPSWLEQGGRVSDPPCQGKLSSDLLLVLLLALCEGADACRENEVCVRPGICRCRAGFFGANCNTREYRGGRLIADYMSLCQIRQLSHQVTGSVSIIYVGWPWISMF